MKQILFILTVVFTFVISMSAQNVLQQAQQMGVTSQQIQQARNNQAVQQAAVQQAAAAGVPQSTIQQGLQELNSQQQEVSSEAGTSQDVQQEGETDQNADAALDTEGNERRGNIRGANRIFGREVFSARNLTFAPSFNIATPKDYRLAAGDELILNIWGTSQNYQTLKISNEGTVIVPDVGPIHLAGMSMQQAEQHMRNELSRIYNDLVSENPETFMSLALGTFRTVKVNMAGEVSVPGTYTLPSLATLFNALYLSGGVNQIGSLRNIKLFRNNKLITQLDVYDYLLNGKSETNIRLEDNDMIIVEPYYNLVTISGKVKRPLTYELKKGETIQQLVEMAGGFTGDSYTDNLQLKRKNGRMFSIYNVEKNDFATFPMEDGDAVTVGQVLNVYANRVIVGGAVWRPGEYSYGGKVSTLLGLLNKAEGVMPDAFTQRIQITRVNPDATTSIIPLDLGAILRGEAPDVPLQTEDIVTIPSQFNMREAYTVSIQGAVVNPKTVPYSEKMTIEDLILQANGLREAAATIRVEVNRRRKDTKAALESSLLAETFEFSISEDLKLADGTDFELKPFDVVHVRFSPSYAVQESAVVGGEVVFTGSYVMNKKNERLSDLIKKAGGVTRDAYLKGASLVRRMNADERARVQALLRISASGIGNRDTIDINALQIDDYPVGIDLAEALKNPGSEADIVLRAGDRLTIPQYISTVKISGAVTYPNTVTFANHKNLADYLDHAGGYTDVSRKRPIVIYANGMASKTKKKLFWYKYPKIEPGCEILVPTKSPDSSKKMSLSEIMSITSSSTSMAAMITSLINTLNK